jgi:cytochrome c-type biogenesis protein CcmF
MTRSGVVQSVHAFGEDRELAWLFTAFMVIILSGSFGLVIYRLPLLRARHELDSWVSREAAFLANNWILLFSAFFVLFATMFPTLSEAIAGQRLTVGAPFFNQWMLPIGLALLVLTGIGPLLAWRKSSLSNLAPQFMWPVGAALVTGAAVTAIGIPLWASGICFALCAFVGITILQEFVRGAKVRQRATATDIFTALVGLVARSRRRYGGYIVHVGIVLMFLGFAGQGFKQDQQLLLKPGQQGTIGRFTIRHDALTVTSDEQKQMVTGQVSVSDRGKPLGEMAPAKWFYNKHESEPTTEVAIRRAPGEDLYVVLAGYDVQSQAATYAVTINPLVNWIWLGFGVLALGTGIALLPERAFAFATARLPAEAATTTLLLLLLLMPAVVHAQHNTDASMVISAPKNDVEKRLREEMGCTCGSCAHEPLTKCTCGIAQRMRDELRQQIDQGKTREQILAHFTEVYGGQQYLSQPLNSGVGALAWLLPYALGASGALVVGVAALRWSRRDDRTATGSAARDSASAEDPSMRARLDDELRDLD